MDEYARFATRYDALLNPFLDAVRQRVVSHCQRAGARRVLDICCGTGRQGIFLEKAGVACVGVDLSDAMLTEARSKVFPQVPLVQTDAVRLPFADASFDASVITFALHEKPHNTAALILDEAFRVAPVCIVVDYVLAERNLELPGQWLMQVPERMVGGDHWRNYRSFMARGAMQGMIHRASLCVVRRDRLFSGGASLFVLAR